MIKRCVLNVKKSHGEEIKEALSNKAFIEEVEIRIKQENKKDYSRLQIEIEAGEEKLESFLKLIDLIEQGFEA